MARRTPDPAAGGRARAASLTPAERSDIASRAARIRWGSALGALGATTAQHETETRGTFEQVEHHVRQGQLALDNFHARGNAGDRRALAERLEQLSYWLGRAYQSQVHGNPSGRAGVVNPTGRAIDMLSKLRAALESCGGT